MSPLFQVALQQWLKQLCRLISGIESAVVVERESDDDIGRSLACWPENVEPDQALLELARKTIETRRQLIHPANSHSLEGADLIAVPLISDTLSRGAVALSMSARSAQKQQAALQAVQWSLRWLELLQEQTKQHHSADSEWLEQLVNTVQVPAELMKCLAEQFNCDRVTLALGDTRRLEMSATYPPVEFKRETGLLRAIKEAMFEAMDQQDLLCYPPTSPAGDSLLRSQQALAEVVGPVSLCTLPLIVDAVAVGALLLERHRQQPFTQQERTLCTKASRLLAPILKLQQRYEQPLVRLIGERLRQRARSWPGPQSLWVKFGLPALALALLMSGLIESNYRIQARASLEGQIQRVVTAPFDGYLQEVSAKAGDVVAQGAPLCQLEDRDLQLEQAKWQTELAKLQRERREALASHERSRVRILQAQSEQLQAELELVEMKLVRSRVKAPLHGVIVSGDLSQSLGAPLKRGEELFKIAPLDSYRVMLQVDERDIGAVQVGQSGSLRLAGYPHLEQRFSVKRILPLSTAAEGSYLFTLEAELDQAGEQLRPGLQGVAKIDAGERSLLWLVGHRLTDWLQLQLWRWWP
jgi:multidrug resistance efflux pump